MPAIDSNELKAWLSSEMGRYRNMARTRLPDDPPWDSIADAFRTVLDHVTAMEYQRQHPDIVMMRLREPADIIALHDHLEDLFGEGSR